MNGEVDPLNYQIPIPVSGGFTPAVVSEVDVHGIPVDWDPHAPVDTLVVDPNFPNSYSFSPRKLGPVQPGPPIRGNLEEVRVKRAEVVRDAVAAGVSEPRRPSKRHLEQEAEAFSPAFAPELPSVAPSPAQATAPTQKSLWAQPATTAVATPLAVPQPAAAPPPRIQVIIETEDGLRIEAWYHQVRRVDDMLYLLFDRRTQGYPCMFPPPETKCRIQHEGSRTIMEVQTLPGALTVEFNYDGMVATLCPVLIHNEIPLD
jgi:hypothetical protein